MNDEERRLAELLRAATPDPPVRITGRDILDRADAADPAGRRAWRLAPALATAGLAFGILTATTLMPSIDPTTPDAAHPGVRASTPAPSTPTRSAEASGALPDRGGDPSPSAQPRAVTSPPTRTPAPSAGGRAPSSTPSPLTPQSPGQTATRTSVERPCRAADLTADLHPPTPAQRKEAITVVVVRNDSSAVCDLTGYPQLPELGKLSAPPKSSTTPPPKIESAPTRVILRPGASASFSLRGVVPNDEPTATRSAIDGPSGGAWAITEFTVPGDETPISLPSTVLLAEAPATSKVPPEVTPFASAADTVLARGG